MTEPTIYYAPFVRNPTLRKIVASTKELAALEKGHASLGKIKSARAAAQGRVDALNAGLTRPRIRDVAQAIMDGGPEVLETMSARDIDPAELARAQRERNALVLAEESQKAQLVQLEQALSIRICEAAAPAYKTMIREMALAAVELAKKQDACRQFRRKLDDEGVTMTSTILRPCEPAPNLFVVNEDSSQPSRLQHFLDEIKDELGVNVAIA